MVPDRDIAEPTHDQELVNRSQVFDDLLRRLRCAHEEVCAHNVRLQLQADGVRFGNGIDTVVPRECTLRLNPNFKIGRIATPRSPFPYSPRPRTPLPQGVTPRRSHPLQVSVFGRGGALDICSSVEQLAMEQKHLNENIAKLLVIPNSSARRHSTAGKTEARVSRTSDTRDTEEKPHDDMSRESLNHQVTLISRQNTIQESRLKRAVDSTQFLITTSLVMMSYMIFIAIETNTIAANPDVESVVIRIGHSFYYSYFLLELGLRVATDGWSAAFFGRYSLWNRLDALFACSAVLETTVEFFAQGSVAKAGSVLLPVRVARVFRTIKILRNCNNLHEFQKMAYALGSSMRTLACSLSLLFFVMFLFAVGLTQSAADKEKRSQIQNLEYWYGDLQSTMYTLYISVSGGLSWHEAYQPVNELGWMSAGAFIIYVSITMFGVLNVVASIFIESVIRSLQHYRDLIVHDKEQERHINVEHMKEVFRQLDADNSGDVTIEELEYFLTTEPSLRRYLEALDISADDTRLLFRLLDRDFSARINVDEFCEGCLRLKGNAKSIDVQTLIFQMAGFLEKNSAFNNHVVKSLDHLLKRFSAA